MKAKLVVAEQKRQGHWQSTCDSPHGNWNEDNGALERSNNFNKMTCLFFYIKAYKK